MKNLYFLFFYLFTSSVSCEDDICGRYAILTKIDEFIISQPFTQQIAIDFSEYDQTFEFLKPNLLKFEEIAKNYSKVELLKSSEPWPLIPFTPEKNLIKIVADQSALSKACNNFKARLLRLEPGEENVLRKIMQDNGMSRVPFFSTAMQKSLFSSQYDVLDSPLSPETKLSTIGSTHFPYFSAEDGLVKYNLNTNTNITENTLCSKDNNFWDRKPNMKYFASTIQSILKTIPSIKKFAEMTSNIIKIFSKLTNSSSQIIPEKFVLPVSTSLTKIGTFLQKFNNVRKWETSKPNDIVDFLDYKSNFKNIARKFNKNKMDINAQLFHNFLQNQTAPLDLDDSDRERLLTHLGLDPVRYGLVNPVTVSPLQSIKANNEETSTSILAKINFRLYDRQDVAKIYDVKPIIFDNKITTIKYVVGLIRNVQALSEEPTPVSCEINNDEDLKICEGFQSPGIETELPTNSFSCGRALMSLNDSINIEKCPVTYAPVDPLAYRAECEPEKRSVVLSSVRPLKIGVVCDTMETMTNIFENFPTKIETECAIKVIGTDAEKIILPQIQNNFNQDQVVGKVTVHKPPVPISDPTKDSQMSTAVTIGLTTLGASFLPIVVFITLLAIFDPAKCANITKITCCCFIRLFYCCKNCCKDCCKCHPVPTDNNDIELHNKRKKSYYVSESSIPSAPMDELQSNFLPSKSPAQSHRSLNEIRIDRSQKQPPSNPRVFTR